MSGSQHRPKWMSAISARDLSPVKEDLDNCRTAFQTDVGTILHSNAFKRLAHKTQVHSLPVSDHIRTRLTHSLEVSQIGRQIARKFSESLIRTKCLKDEAYFNFVSDIQELTSAACLCHDIGHSPFGHVGKDILEDLSPASHKFDDNKQVIRILLNPMFSEDLRTTAPLVAGVMKKFTPEEVSYDSEKPQLEAILKQLNLGKDVRHPVSFFMEAADDIGYLAADLLDYLTHCRSTHTEKGEEHKKLMQILKEIPDLDSQKSLMDLFAEAQNFAGYKKFSNALLRAGLLHVMLSFKEFEAGAGSDIEEIPSKYSAFVQKNAHKYKKKGVEKIDHNPLYLGVGSNGMGKKFFELKELAYKGLILREKHIAAQNLQADAVIRGLWGYFDHVLRKNPTDLQKMIMNSLLSIMPAEVHEHILKAVDTNLKESAVVDLIACMTDRYATEFWETLRTGPIKFRNVA